MHPNTLFQRKILSWYYQHGRKDLPWQKNMTPYRVWLSEIMLQQTQVPTVIPYFKNFTKHFPTLTSLAKANIDEVLHHWTGLGYYSRAHNLHKTANIIVKKFHGRFPRDLDALQTLPGIGRSTAGAILSLAMQQRAPILDGNVKRVLTRHFAIKGYFTETTTIKQLWKLAEQLTPIKHIREYTQAMMDLGAIICARTKPNCKKCPLKKTCTAHLNHQEEQFPQKKTKKNLPIKKTIMLVLQNSHGEILLEQRPAPGIWGGLWSFPECQNSRYLKAYCRQTFGCLIKSTKKLSPFRHTFSHFHLEITPILLQTEPKGYRTQEGPSQLWYNLKNPRKVGLPQPIKRLLKKLTT